MCAYPVQYTYHTQTQFREHDYVREHVAANSTTRQRLARIHEWSWQGFTQRWLAFLKGGDAWNCGERSATGDLSPQ